MRPQISTEAPRVLGGHLIGSRLSMWRSACKPATRVRCRPMIAVVDEAPTAVIPAVYDGGPRDYTGRVTTKESES